MGPNKYQDFIVDYLQNIPDINAEISEKTRLNCRKFGINIRQLGPQKGRAAKMPRRRKAGPGKCRAVETLGRRNAGPRKCRAAEMPGRGNAEQTNS